MIVTSGSRCYKISMKNSKCVVSNKHIQDGRPGRYENRRRTKKYVQTDHPVVPDTRRQPEEAEKRAKPSVVPYHPGKCRKDPPESRCNLSVDLCKNSGTFLKIPEELLVVNFIDINVFGRFVMKLDLADPNFAGFRSNSANIMYFS